MKKQQLKPVHIPVALLALLLPAGPAGCTLNKIIDDTPHPCNDQDCSGHGSCIVIRNDIAVCICDPGYEPDGLACVDPDTPAPDSIFSETVSGLEPGEFQPLDGNTPEGFDSYGDLVKAHASDADRWSDSAHWDSGRRRVFMYADRNEAVFIAYLADTNEWRILSTQGPRSQKYVYGSVGLDPGGFYYKFGTADGKRTLYRYSIPHDFWITVETVFPGTATGWAHTDPIEWHDALNSLVYIRVNEVFGFQDGEWQKYGDAAVDGYHSSAQYNRTRREMMFIGGNKSRSKVSLLDDEGVILDLEDAPFEFSIANSSLTYDPLTGNYLVVLKTDVRVMWELDPSIDEWRMVFDWTEEGWPFDNYGGIVPVPIDDYGVILWLNPGGPKLYLHKSVFN